MTAQEFVSFLLEGDSYDKEKLPASARKYYRLKSPEGVSSQKAQDYIDMEADLTNQKSIQKGFQNRNVGQYSWKQG